MRARLRDIKKLFCGLPFLHFITDVWTERRSHQSFGSVVVRCVHLGTNAMGVTHLGVSVCRGPHDRDSIRRWVLRRLDFFDMAESDVRSTTTDSGDNVRKVMRDLATPWLP